MADDLTVAPPDLPDVVLALSPEQLGPARDQMIAWCDQRLARLQQDEADLDDHALIAANNGWKLTGVTRQLARVKRERRYYAGVRKALQAGYLLVPNMPMDILAVRVKRDGPRTEQRAEWTGSRAFTTLPELPEIGEGYYVDQAIPCIDTSYERTNPHTQKSEQVTQYTTTATYAAPDFPTRFVKPIVLKRTQQAMALKVFDQIGLVRQDSNIAGRDPIMVGRILSGRRQARAATFFVAWWMPLEQL